METPIITIKNDFDNVFENRVKAAIQFNIDRNNPMVNEIIITAGPYRSYCLSFEKSENIIHLDFYAANRVFGFEHTIEDIANCIKK